MASSGKLVKTSTTGTTTTLAFSGKLDEEALSELVDIEDKLASKVVVDFGKVTNVNSVGVRDWVKFLRSISPNRTVTFINCTDDVIRSISMVRQFAENAVVKSMLRTYTCEVCDHDIRHVLERDVHFSSTGPIALMNSPCKSCSVALSAVIPDEEYFAFLGTA